MQEIQAAVQSVSSTAGKINSAYATASSAVQTGKHYYDIFKSWVGWLQDLIQRIDPYLEPVKRYWLIISNNNEPKRVAIIIGVIIILYLLIRFRNVRYRQPYDR